MRVGYGGSRGSQGLIRGDSVWAVITASDSDAGTVTVTASDRLWAAGQKYKPDLWLVFRTHHGSKKSTRNQPTGAWWAPQAEKISIAVDTAQSIGYPG